MAKIKDDTKDYYKILKTYFNSKGMKNQLPYLEKMNKDDNRVAIIKLYNSMASVDKSIKDLKESYMKAKRNLIKEHFEGDFLKKQLKNIAMKASNLAGMMESDTDVDAWVQDKISVSNHNLDAIFSYLTGNDYDIVSESLEEMSEEDGSSCTYEEAVDSELEEMVIEKVNACKTELQEKKGSRDKFLILRVSKDERNKMKRAAKRMGLSVSNLVRQIVDKSKADEKG